MFKSAVHAGNLPRELRVVRTWVSVPNEGLLCSPSDTHTPQGCCWASVCISLLSTLRDIKSHMFRQRDTRHLLEWQWLLQHRLTEPVLQGVRLPRIPVSCATQPSTVFRHSLSNPLRYVQMHRVLLACLLKPPSSVCVCCVCWF